MSVCIIGAGIVGVSTALKIQQLEPRAKVTLMADEFSPDVTSDVAAGHCRPYLVSDPRKERIIKWGAETFAYIERLAYREPEEVGAMWSSGYEMRTTPFVDLFWKDTVRNYRTVSHNELADMGFEQFNHGIFYTTVVLESSVYLPKMMERFRQNGGIIVKKKLTTLNDIGREYDTIGNCTGLGARRLVNDQSVFPIRGQVVRVHAPHIKHFYLFDDDHYILQNRHSFVVGGTHQENDWNTTVRQSDFNNIWSGATKYLPALTTAKIIKSKVGLRPARPAVRLEAESMRVEGGQETRTVVHNYGHGGAGITLFYGCALQAADLLRQAVHRPNARL